MENKKTINIFNWIKTYPKKATILTLLIIIPIVIIVLGSISFSRKNNRFYFDKNGDEPVYLHQKDVSSQKQINKYFEQFEIITEKLLLIDSNTDDAKEEYEFKLDAKANPDYKNASINYRYVLATKYHDKQSSVSSSTSYFRVTYPYSSDNLKNKLLVFKPGRPSLYVEISIVTTGVIGQENRVVLIYKLDLNKTRIISVEKK